MSDSQRQSDELPPEWDTLSGAERAVDGFLRGAHLAAAHELPPLVAQQAQVLGAWDAVVYLADLQQTQLVPFLGPEAPGAHAHPQPLSIDTTLAGLAFQRSDVLSQRDEHIADAPRPGHGVRLWIPLIDGTERLGVLGLIVDEDAAHHDPLLQSRLWRFATVVAEVVMSKTLYGDAIVLARRQAPMALAAEIQWGLLPPLTFACQAVVVAGALEPAYEVAGDSIDYAVDAGVTRFAVFDSMGHGLHSATLSALAVAAYRNARRSARSLTMTADAIDTAITEVFGGEMFATAVVAELDTDSGVLSWINAGHPEPLLLRDHHIVKPLRVPPGLPFGLDLTPQPEPYQIGTVRLQPGDQVLLYTDGVIEARSPTGEFFGLDRLIDLITRHDAAGLSPAETMRRVVRSLLQHQQSQLSDDASLLLVDYRSGAQDLLMPEDLPLPRTS